MRNMNEILEKVLKASEKQRRSFSQHAYISPSNLHKYLHCPAASRREFLINKRREFLSAFAEGNPVATAILEQDTSDADDGTFAHALYEQIVGMRDGVSDDVIREEVYKSVARYGSEKLHEDYSFMEKFTNVCLETRRMLKNASWFAQELRVVLPKYGMWGTADLVFQVGKTLVVWDLKTGRQEVSAENNEQLLAYALGILEIDDWKSFDAVQLGIVGVRFPMSIWETTPKAIKEFKENVLEPALKEAYEIGSCGKVGEHCMYCRAKLYCPEWNAMVTYCVDQKLFDVEEEGFKNLDNKILVDRFLLAKQVERFQQDAKDEIALRYEGFGNMDEEKRVKYVRPMPILEYKNEEEAVEFIEETLGLKQINEFVVKKPINPSRLKGLVPKEDYERLTVEKSRKPYVKMA